VLFEVFSYQNQDDIFVMTLFSIKTTDFPFFEVEIVRGITHF